ncbi:glyoxalase [Cellulomonas aerilata]|uniref:Glyoxalase n=1 Tax=Cellulomonas aerilata TaxID=515326 RepID=A0A512DAX3_9CELL|nr:glyoxalase [Cellulomonas aerilata]GEO33631.1 glyoxalase [Cellulomonas aerilata]
MDVQFVAGFGPIARSGAESLAFWSGTAGIRFEEVAPGYFATDDLPGTKAFAIWPLEQAAESTFGTSTWPPEHPVPQAWIELDVAGPEAVAAAVSDLEAAGCTVLRRAREEPWGQTTARLRSPEHLLVGISHTPWMHT